MRGDCVGDIAQVFIILAYLAIALISVTVPTYAISVSYIGREAARTSEIIKKRREELKDKLAELTSKESPKTKELKGEIKRYEERIEEAKANLSFLSVKGAVGYPLLLFSLALTFSVLGTCIPVSQNTEMFLLFGIIFVGLGLACLGRTLISVERVALNPPSPKFEIEFESGTTVEKIGVGKRKEISLIFTNVGEDLAENVRLIMFFPPEFDVIEKKSYDIFKQTGDVRYPNYNAVHYDLFLPACVYVNDAPMFEVSLIAPRRARKYEIPVYIDARNMGRSEHRLVIEVVEEKR